MLHSLRKLWSPVTEARPRPVVPPDQRVYAIGDIHGRLDLMAAMIGAIEADDRARSAADTTVVLLGDLVDRGPHSSGVLRAARIWQERRNLRLLRGNHEDMFLESLEDLQVFRSFLQYGGHETVLSYRVDAKAFEEAEPEDAQAMMIAAVPREDIEFIAEFEDFVVIGDYLFVHAGIRPGRPLLDQSPQEMRWIREPFLSYLDYHEHVVVHGHTIVDEPEIYHNRIGIDTGAYMSGRLTALALEADQRWLIETEKLPDGRITVASRPILPDGECAMNMPGDL